MRVLHVTASMSPEWGGPAKVTAELAAALEQQEVRCEIATVTGHRVGNDMVAVSSVVPVHCFAAGFPARLWTAYSHRLADFLERETGRFDVVHAHEIWHHASYAAFRAARRHEVPYLLSFHGALDEWRLRQKRFKKSIYRRLVQDNIIQSADALHALTRAEEKRIRELGYTTPVFIAPNGINLSGNDNGRPGLPGHPYLENPDSDLSCQSLHPENPVSDFREKYPQLRGRQIILFLGRLHAMKGLDILARAFAAIADRHPDATLLVVGPDEDGSQRRMQSILREAGALNRTVFTGLLTGPDKQAALECADMFVLPSYSEGFSNAILEALAAGLPVVISSQCYFPEVAENEVGFVVEAEGDAVAGAMSRLLSDTNLRLRMGWKGRNLVAERYSWTSVAATLAGVYRTLAENRRSVFDDCLSPIP